MKALREKLPSGSVTLALRQYRGDEESDKLGNNSECQHNYKQVQTVA